MEKVIIIHNGGEWTEPFLIGVECESVEKLRADIADAVRHRIAEMETYDKAREAWQKAVSDANRLPRSREKEGELDKLYSQRPVRPDDFYFNLSPNKVLEVDDFITSLNKPRLPAILTLEEWWEEKLKEDQL